MGNKQANKAEMNWRSWFNPKTLALAEQDEENGRLMEFSYDEEGTWAKGRTSGGFSVEVINAPNSYSSCVKVIPWNLVHKNRRRSRYDSWYSYDDFFYGYEDSLKVYHSCSCSVALQGQLCRHLGCLMIHWEKIRGPFSFTETPEEARERQLAEIEREKQRRIEEEEERRRKREREEREALERERFPVQAYLTPLLPEIPSDIMFRPDALLKGFITNRCQSRIFEAYQREKKEADLSWTIVYDEDGKQNLKLNGEIDDHQTFVQLTEKGTSHLNCSCGASHGANPFAWTEEARTPFMCAHMIATCFAAWNMIVRENPGDATDKNANTLLSVLAGKSLAAPVQFENVEKRADVELVPRITRDKDNGSLQLAFSIGFQGQRSYKLRGLDRLYRAVGRSETLELSKKMEIDFSEYTFTPETEKWYGLVASRGKNIDALNRRLSGGGYYYYYEALKLGPTIPMEGGELDAFYDLAEGSTIQYQKTAGEELTVQVKKGRLRMELTLEPVYGRGRSLKAIMLQGQIPVTMQGIKYQYILDDRQFGRIETEEYERLAPYRSAAAGGHSFSCVIGRRKFAEFFYRVLPELQNAEYITVTDHVGDKAARLLPPEPEFSFYLDVVDGLITCKAFVSYGEQEYSMMEANLNEGREKDEDQEERVKDVICRYFPDANIDGREMSVPDEGEALLRILTEGVAALSQFGQVKGSDAFYSYRIRKAPRPRVQVSLESGILDLTIQTKDMTPEELLELMASYRRKKRWHRLKSGDFVDLEDTEQLRELDELSEGMDISLDELIRGGVKLPAYRALYLDKMLEEHDDLAASRDRHFKSLIRSYSTIRDSDFEVSGELAEILRPYQVYGFRWLCTLAQSGFGGILADEMGLGKTIQVLSLLKSAFDAGETRPALVVCPASLVYNWVEECRRFTPLLPVTALAGTASQREETLSGALSGNEFTLLVTSYDLLKRDILLYKDVAFSSVILDEAQYIKNPKAAVTKSVKTLKAEHRYALTGTPIENRLSELWSIFDFLMPGFLYTASEYTTRFETPIMKNRDSEAADKLARMTEPFILRRKKMEVLKDLPEKLEETQSTAMEGDQRKLYDAQVARMKKLLDSFEGSGEDKIRMLAEITRLRQICCDPSLVFDQYKGPSSKREACLDLVKRAMDGGHRMLLFSQFTSMLDLLEQDLKKEGIPFFVITGATPKQERLRLVNEFNGGDTPLFLISLKAGGTGLNLTGADVVIHYDPWWNLAVQNQATDRSHRIGQTRQVTVMKLIAADSIEERIVELQEAKRDLADAIIGNQTNSLMSLSREELMALLS